MFLGWTEGKLAGHHYFVRQLRDIKISMRVDLWFPRNGSLCHMVWKGARAGALSIGILHDAEWLSGEERHFRSGLS